jgi:hypothetical protein
LGMRWQIRRLPSRDFSNYCPASPLFRKRTPIPS